jgi:hypothetical protein
VHLRRALLLFAIVLGLAAVAASVSGSGEESGEPTAPATDGRDQPTVEPGPVTGQDGPATVDLDAGPRERVRVEAGRPVTLEVNVDEPGLVEIPALGLSAPGEPLTPARFDLLARDSGRIAVTFTPADGDADEPAGTLVVREPRQ